MREIKLLVDGHFFDYEFVHGARIYIQGIYSELIRMNTNIHFYIVANDIDNLEKEFGNPSNVTFVKYKNTNKYYRLVFDIPNIIKKYQIDYLHVQYISPLRKTCKEIVTTHDILFNDYPEYFSLSYKYLSNFLFKRSAKRADLLLTVSGFSKKAISKHYQIDDDKIHITPNAASEDFIKFAENENNLPDIKSKYGFEKYILYVSRVEPRKNHLLLLKSYCELRLWEKDYKLVFVGKKNVESKVFDNYYAGLSKDVKENIIQIDQVDHSELIAFYKNADLFVYPSLAEGFGIPPIEAAVAGIPCLCSNATAMNDFSFFKDRFFDPNDIEELKSKMLAIINDQDKILTVEIKNSALHIFNWKNIAQKYLQLLESSFNENI